MKAKNTKTKTQPSAAHRAARTQRILFAVLGLIVVASMLASLVAR